MKFFISINAILFAISFILIINQSAIIVVGQTSKLEKLLPTYRVVRNLLFDFIGRTDTDWAYRWNLKRKVKFICIYVFEKQNIYPTYNF